MGCNANSQALFSIVILIPSMQEIVDQITDHLVGLVKSDKPAYGPKELLKAGIPSFVVERVRLHLEDKVREELKQKDAFFFDDSTQFVSNAWEDYLNAALSASHIPKEELYSILNTVIQGIINVFIEPRKNMAEYIFREEEELGYDEIEVRCNRLTIYKHFGTAIPLYMRKKSLEILTKERCQVLIKNLDAKLVASYTAEDWAQKLEQLFILFGGKVDPKLLTIFFQDKGLTVMAQKFQATKGFVTKEDFIQIISSDSFVNFSVTDSENEVRDSNDAKSAEKGKEAASKSTLSQNYIEGSDQEDGEELSLASQFMEGGLSDEEMNELLEDIANDGFFEDDEIDESDSLNQLFSLSHEQDNEEAVASETSEEIAESIKSQKNSGDEDIKEFRENLISILDQAKSSFENVTAEEHSEELSLEKDDSSSVFQEKEEEAVEDIDEEIFESETEEEELTEGEEKPVWAQFLSSDQMDVMMGSKRDASSNEENDESLENEDGIEVSEELYVADEFFESGDSIFETEEKQVERIDIEDLLVDRKEEFIKIIFSNSEAKYNKAMKKLRSFDNWDDTSKFIQKEIFAKNNVDLFSGATVDFTDRLQSYFISS